MQALGLVRISQKQNFIEILLGKISQCKKMGLGRNVQAMTLAVNAMPKCSTSSSCLPASHCPRQGCKYCHHADVAIPGSPGTRTIFQGRLASLGIMGLANSKPFSLERLEHHCNYLPRVFRKDLLHWGRGVESKERKSKHCSQRRRKRLQSEIGSA